MPYQEEADNGPEEWRDIELPLRALPTAYAGPAATIGPQRQRTEILLQAWRAADRRWEATPPDDPTLRGAAIEVIRAWLGYHEAVDPHHPGEFALVADEGRVYVAATASVETALGYAPEALHGTRADELAGAAVASLTEDLWSAFVAAGRQDGEFELRRNDGSAVRLQYQARAHYPIAGYHLSRMWPTEPA